MKIFKMIIIFMLCFMMVGCGKEKPMTYEEKLNQVISVYKETNDSAKAMDEISSLYQGEFTNEDSEEQIKLIKDLTAHMLESMNP